MLRQLANLRHLGRLRTAAPMPRRRKPLLLRERPELEIQHLLEFVVAHHGRPHADFFFIQIGAFDGRTGDPLYQLVCRHGWRGILVEPQPEAFCQLQTNYAGQAGLQFFNVAIGPTDTNITLYSRRQGDVSTASTVRHLLVKPGHSPREILAYSVPCWTLETLLARARVSRPIDLLQIDAEGFDYEIIRSIDFARVRPAILRYEHVLLSRRDRDACLALLARHGYRFLLEDRDTTALLPDRHLGRAPQ